MSQFEFLSFFIISIFPVYHKLEVDKDFQAFLVYHKLEVDKTFRHFKKPSVYYLEGFPNSVCFLTVWLLSSILQSEGGLTLIKGIKGDFSKNRPLG